MLPLLLVVVFLLLDPLGASCSDDILDNPDYSCNAGGDIQWALYFAIPVSVIAAMVVLATWPKRRWRPRRASSSGRRSRGSRW